MSSSKNAISCAPIKRPQIQTDMWSTPFWEATRRQVLVAQQDETGHIWFPPAPVSPVTGSDQWQWTPLSGKAVVRSWVVFHRNYFSGVLPDTPYIVALVQLKEGPAIYTNIIGCASSGLAIGMAVEVAFVPLEQGYWLPVFQPAAQEGAP